MRTRSGACYPSRHAAAEGLEAAHRRKRRRTAAAERSPACAAAACGRGDMFEELPDDLVVSILADVAATAGSPADLAGAMLTCKRFRELGQSKVVLARASPRCLAVPAKAWSDDAHRFLQRCADVGNLEACYLLGMIRFYCLGSRGPGAALMASAAVGGHREALYSLAVIQFNGSGGSKDDRDLRAGAALCARAASLGHVDALRELGHCLQDGYGVRRSVVDGRRLLIQANARELAAVTGSASAAGTSLLRAAAGTDDKSSGGKAYSQARQRHACLLSEFGCRVAVTGIEAPHPANRFLVDWFASRPPVAAGTGTGTGTGTEDEDGGGLRLCSHTLCGRPETRRHEFRRCSVCGTANYCSRACQALHWKVAHKAECTAMDRWLDAVMYPNAAAVAAAAAAVAAPAP